MYTSSSFPYARNCLVTTVTRVLILHLLQKRWTATAQDILDDEVNLTGDIFLSAAFVSYLGAFTGSFRRTLSENWAMTLRDKGVRVSDGYSLTKVNAEHYTDVHSWFSARSLLATSR